jgi:CHAT domain-containing protein
MPTTPGQVDLLGVHEEVKQIEKIVGGRFSVRSLAYPDTKEVLECLGDYDMVHFACHGLSDLVDPSESCLIFQQAISSQEAIPISTRQQSHSLAEEEKVIGIPRKWAGVGHLRASEDGWRQRVI